MLTIQFDASPALAALDKAAADLEAGRLAMLQNVGVQILSFAQLAYVEKARGGTGSDGITWKKDQRSTIEARVRSRAPAKRIVERRRALAAQINAMKGKGAAAKVASLRRQRKELSAKLQSMIDTEYAQYEIGVDTGLQRASASPGFSGPDGHGGNVLNVTAVEITVGYGREYSEWFDTARPLLPETLPAAWLTSIETLAEEWGGRILNNALGGD